MKSVLISIMPKWCALISRGIKTVEVRKTKPKLQTPFKCYIYCTKGKANDPHSLLEIHATDGKIRKGNGKVIGEFVCDVTEDFTPTEKGVSCKRFSALHDTQLTVSEIRTYLTGKVGYGWHITDLVIYDVPKELSAFTHCGVNYHFDPQITRAPQSWCYVEEDDDR